MALAKWELGPQEVAGAGGGAGTHHQPLPQGKIGDRVGFFPANFVQRVRPGENVWRCCRPFSGNKEQGYLSLKENQVSRGLQTVGEEQGWASCHSLLRIVGSWGQRTLEGAGTAQSTGLGASKLRFECRLWP